MLAGVHHTSSLAQLLQCLGQWPPAQLLQLLPALNLAIVIDLLSDVPDASETVGVSERGKDGGGYGSGAEHEGKTSPWDELVW